MMHDEEFLNEAIRAYSDSKGIHSLLLELRERRRAEKDNTGISVRVINKNRAETITEPLKDLLELRKQNEILKTVVKTQTEYIARLRDEFIKTIDSLPVPCKKAGDKLLDTCTVKEWMGKINEEVTELHEAIISYEASKCGGDFNNFVEEATDVITVMTSMLAAYGCTEEDRMDAQRKVNLKNEKRGRLY